MAGDPSEQIDEIIRKTDDWRGSMMSSLREIIKQSDPEIVEEVKWKKPSNPLGVPVWSLEGIICIGNILNKAVRLTFSKGSQISDPSKLFNTRLDSKTVRAVDFFEGDRIDEKALTKIVQRAVTLNLEKSKLKK